MTDNFEKQAGRVFTRWTRLDFLFIRNCLLCAYRKIFARPETKRNFGSPLSHATSTFSSALTLNFKGNEMNSN